MRRRRFHAIRWLQHPTHPTLTPSIHSIPPTPHPPRKHNLGYQRVPDFTESLFRQVLINTWWKVTLLGLQDCSCRANVQHASSCNSVHCTPSVHCILCKSIFCTGKGSIEKIENKIMTLQHIRQNYHFLLKKFYSFSSCL